MEHDHMLNRNDVFERLYHETRSISQSEEYRHPWRKQDHEAYEVPLLRIWDHYSGSKPSRDHIMKSRTPEMRLDTYETRKNSLAKHLDYMDRTPGPYISFTTNPAEIQGHVMKRRRGRDRGPHTLTVIDPNKRTSMGLPILEVLAEMDRYGIPDPYGLGNAYYFDEHVCLWQVTEAEIVGHFPWDALEQNDNWYQDIIMPAFREFTEQQPVNPTEDAIDDLLHGFNELSVGHDDSDSSDTGYAERSQCYYSDGEEDADSVGEFQCVYSDEDYYWDTDDDLEEANAADDIINIIEGYWR